MEEQNNNVERFDDVVLPGFRFHPTDEELVGFYLKRKILQKSLPIELIKQVDIYKYDPWDLPKLATMGEKEWYFYCPRDRKYRNSTRPNRVTGAGFWKATGTDRPIYSSDGTKCIGLKKSLVFYRGRAAKGIKTDWMMHEFRLPSLSDSHHHSPKKQHQQQLENSNRDIPSNEAWAICRIFKKTNSVSSQRAISQSWVSPTAPQTCNQTSTAIVSSDILNHFAKLSQESSIISCTTQPGLTTLIPTAAAAAAAFTSQMVGVPYSTAKTHNNNNNINTTEAASVMNVGAIISNNDQNYFTMALPQELPNVRLVGFPFTSPEAWRASDVATWETAQCTSEMSATSYSTNN